MSFLFKGQVGDYFSSNSNNDLPLAVLALKRREILKYLGTLTCSQFPNVEIYAFATFDGRISVNVMNTPSGLGGIDCVSKFLDGSFLTTTNNSVLDSYRNQGLHRISRPNLTAEELFESHVKNIDDFSFRCGTAQSIFVDILAVAKFLDEYIMRSRTNFFYGLVTFVGGLFTSLRQTKAK